LRSALIYKSFILDNFKTSLNILGISLFVIITFKDSKLFIG
jgi:hypothetical protein